jgi:RNA-directed DNA polymerase
VRYCDDFVILLKSRAKAVMHQIKQFLKRLKLELHETKTRIVHARKGFDFLGVHFRLVPTTSKKIRRKYYCARWPSNVSMKSIRRKIKERIGRRYRHSLEDVIRMLNPLIIGWKNYHAKIGPVRDRFRKLDEYVRLRLRIFIKRKYTLQNKGCGKLRDNLVGKLGLAQFVF